MKIQASFTKEESPLRLLTMVPSSFRIFRIMSVLALVATSPLRLDPSRSIIRIIHISSITTISISSKGGPLLALTHRPLPTEMLLSINFLICPIISTSHLLHGAATKAPHPPHRHLGALVVVGMEVGEDPKAETTAGDLMEE